jgi:hypothetical protein
MRRQIRSPVAAPVFCVAAAIEKRIATIGFSAMHSHCYVSSALLAMVLTLSTAAAGAVARIDGDSDVGDRWVATDATASFPTGSPSDAVPGLRNSSLVLRNGGTVGPSSAPSSCIMPLVRSSLSVQQVQQLGTLEVGKTAAFQVPPNTGTISIIEQAVGASPQTILYGAPPNASPVPNVAVVTLITEPNGTVLYDDNANVPADLTAVHLVTDASVDIGVVTFPNTTRAFVDSGGGGYPPGTWTVQVNDYALECTLPANSAICSGGTDKDQYDLTVITKPIAGPTGTLDVSVYLASESLNATDAIASPSMQRYAQTLANLYLQVGIDLGTVTVYDLPPWAKARYATGVDSSDTGPCSDIGQLLTLSNPGNEISFFFVDSIQAATGDNSGQSASTARFRGPHRWAAPSRVARS